MKRIFTLLACVGVLSLAACTSETDLPDPTGKGSVRAVNAIPGSPEIRFLIEERTIGAVRFGQSSPPVSFDDFEYNFNFDLFLPGSPALERVATEVFKIEADSEHVFILTGDPLAPTVTVFTTTAREYEQEETVFENRFTHQIQSLSDTTVDVYFDEFVDPPVPVNRVATLAHREVSAPQDFEQGEYVITITRADDINDVLYTSVPTLIGPRVTQLTTMVDGTANDTSQYIVGMTGSTGTQRRLPDASALPTIRFIHGSYPLPTVDIYDDDLLTSRIVEDLAHGETFAPLEVSGDVEEYFWTPANSTETILLQGGYVAPFGTRSYLSVVGDTDEWVYFSYQPDLEPVSIYARLQLFQTALDNDFVDVFVVDADAEITEDDLPFAVALFTPTLSASQPIEAGSYDVYVTLRGERTPITAPFRLDLADGDVAELMIIDTADPAVADIRAITLP